MERIKRGKNEFVFLTVREAIELYKKGLISLTLTSNDSDIQRNVVWGKQDKFDYIDTIFQADEGLSVIYAVNKEKVWEIEDGKQKFSTLISFIDNEFTLGEMRLVDDEDISDKTFSELSEELQEKFLDADLEIKLFAYESDEQVADIFVKLNGGQKLRPMEKMRADLAKHIPFLQEMAKSNYFVQNLSYSASQRNRFADIDLALGLVLEEFNPGSDQNKKTKEKFAKDLKEKFDIKKEAKEKILKKLEYLNVVLEAMFSTKESEKKVRKYVLPNSNRVILYKIVKDCLSAKYETKHVYDFLYDYFIVRGHSYFMVAGTTSTSNKSSLDKRYKEIKEDMKEYMKKVEKATKQKSKRTA